MYRFMKMHSFHINPIISLFYENGEQIIAEGLSEDLLYSFKTPSPTLSRCSGVTWYLEAVGISGDVRRKWP
jgi:hypothetical protein